MKKIAMMSLVLFAGAVSLAFAAIAPMTAYKADLTQTTVQPAGIKLGAATFEVTGGGIPDTRTMDPAQESHLYDQGTAVTEASAGGPANQALHYRIELGSISKPATADLRMGKSSQTEGAVVAPLHLNAGKTGKSGTVAEGTITARDLQGPLAGKSVQDLVKAINEGDVYVNVATSPGGELRGQVEPA